MRDRRKQFQIQTPTPAVLSKPLQGQLPRAPHVNSEAAGPLWPPLAQYQSLAWRAAENLKESKI